MNVTDVMTPEFEMVRHDASLLEAMRRLRESPEVEDEIGIKCVVVLDADDALVGVLTQSDVVGEILYPYFVRNLANPAEGTPTFKEEDFEKLAAWASKVKVKDVMTRNPTTLKQDTTIFEAADTIVSRKVKSLPVVDGDKVIGIVYRSSLYRRIAESILGAAVS